MFKNIFEYWTFNSNNNSFNIKINMWAFTNSQNFKFKLNNYIVIFTNNLVSITSKKIKIFYKNHKGNVILIHSIVFLLFFILLFTIV